MISSQYAAGLFDGEGCISIQEYKGIFQKSVRLAATYRPVVEALCEKYRGNIACQTTTHRNAHYWYLTSKNDIAAFLEDVLPYLLEKKQQAEVMLEVCTLPTKQGMTRSDDTLTKLYLAKDRLKELKRIEFDFVPTKRKKYTSQISCQPRETAGVPGGDS